jgi:hypothetical protein
MSVYDQTLEDDYVAGGSGSADGIDLDIYVSDWELADDDDDEYVDRFLVEDQDYNAEEDDPRFFLDDHENFIEDEW